MNPWSGFWILVIVAVVGGALYANRPQAPVAVVEHTQWSYDPPIYLCHMTKVFGYAPNPDGWVTPKQAGFTSDWVTFGPRDGLKPTSDDPNIGVYEGGFDPYINTDSGKDYFFNLPCDGPFTDNFSLCNAVKARNLGAYAANYPKNDCRIFLAINQ